MPLVDKCSVCGCTEMNPCKLVMNGVSPLDPNAIIEACGWLDAAHSLCSNNLCVAKTPMAEIAKLRLIFRTA